jgi:endonuclease-3
MKEKTALKQIKFMEKNSGKMRLAAEEWRTSWQILISTILSARTRDETTIIVSKKLFKKYPNEKKLAKAKIKDVEKTIRPVNFYRNKSKNIINCSKELIKKYKGKIPKTIEGLITFSGVGRKTANVFLAEIGEEGIGVDTHVSYISQKLNWTKNKNPAKIEQDLKKLFSKKNWGVVNSRLVRFGKTHTSKKKKDELLEEVKKIK